MGIESPGSNGTSRRAHPHAQLSCANGQVTQTLGASSWRRTALTAGIDPADSTAALILDDLVERYGKTRPPTRPSTATPYFAGWRSPTILLRHGLDRRLAFVGPDWGFRCGVLVRRMRRQPRDDGMV
jgi:hypothetical protein